MSEQEKENRSYELRTKIEADLHELAGVMEPDEVVEFVESVADKMRRELEEEA